MKCEICNVNDANIVFTQIINSEKKVMHICQSCAKNKGLTVEVTSNPENVKSIFDKVADAAKENDKSKKVKAEPVPDITCPSCDLTFAEFKEDGLFGCSECHVAFQEHLPRILKQIHGAAVHNGKAPSELTEDAVAKKELRTLKSKLKRCVDKEEYEKAAKIRDRIALLEKEVENA
jgi:protein arginine kinase activator